MTEMDGDGPSLLQRQTGNRDGGFVETPDDRQRGSRRHATAIQPAPHGDSSDGYPDGNRPSESDRSRWAREQSNPREQEHG